MAHSIIIALDGTLLGLLRAKAQATHNAPDLRLAKSHTVHAFDNCSHTLECPQLGAKAMLCGALQGDCTDRSKLRRVKLGGASRLWQCPQKTDVLSADFAVGYCPTPALTECVHIARVLYSYIAG